MDTNLIAYSALIGFFLPILLGIISQESWNSQTKAVLAFMSYVAAALIITYFRNEFNVNDLVTSFGTVLVLAISGYKGLWKPVGIEDAIHSLTDLSKT